MNINQIKDFLNDKPQHLGSKESIQNQLRDSGLKQAADLQSNFISLQVDKFSSSATFGVRVFSNALNSTLEVNNQKPNFSEKKSQESNNSMFDFEEVAKNVLKFVGGAIKNAKNSGADEAELNKLFEQATSGVLKGIKMAEKDLAGFLNDEIEKGISNSKKLIEQGIEALRQQIFDPTAGEDDTSTQANSVTKSTDVSYAKLEMGELNIRTRDGDQVSIRFEDLESFELSQKEIKQLATPTEVVEEQTSETAVQVAVDEKVAANAAADTATTAPSAVTTAKSGDDKVEELAEEAQQSAQPQQTTVETASELNAIYYQQQSFSFSVTGELDEGELQAIGKLVNDVNVLAEEFFNGDIETAFNQALELGFDDKELTGFALQLTKVENTQVIKAYEAVSHFDEDNLENEDPSKAVKPVADYLEKLLNVLDGARLHLEDSKSYENVVNELINRLGDVATPDLITAIHRFNDFNQKLIDNLPIGFKPQV
ncbi:DUF5610 domain-containing protein [Paraglaciecola sp. L3A3]|uniref:DUF5610 domain-containing protein n=1 Tax=Paraglaciecola sp. L3A3 TaxID=2686358 RepID=UPI00131E284D|nr:DUF5610 domain-containing protein [Paraglaciecola sp. L3A3]